MASKLLSESKSGESDKVSKIFGVLTNYLNTQYMIIIFFFKCKPEQTLDQRKEYCKTIPENAPNLIADCMSGSVWDFCYACCDNEFG